jgi:hypothetical protein
MVFMKSDRHFIQMITKILQLIIAASLLRLTFSLNGLPSTTARQNHLFRPPWRPSALIENDGFLKESLFRKQGEWEKELRLPTIYDTHQPCAIRQVPGDGNCLFHALSLCLYYSTHKTHYDMSNGPGELYTQSRSLRAKAVACLRQNDRVLFIGGTESLLAIDLVSDGATTYGISPKNIVRKWKRIVCGRYQVIAEHSNLHSSSPLASIFCVRLNVVLLFLPSLSA